MRGLSQNAFFRLVLFVALLSFGCVKSIISQNNEVENFLYISPEQGSSLVSPYTNIILRLSEANSISGKLKQNNISVKGSLSGNHSGRLKLLEDNKTIIFKPDVKFTLGERIKVEIKLSKLSTSFALKGDTVIFEFMISKSWALNSAMHSDFVEELKSSKIQMQYQQYSTSKIDTKKARTDSLPENLPNIYITHFNNPSDGFIFMAPWYFLGSYNGPDYLMIVDNYGIPIYYKEHNDNVLAQDFKVQPNGMLTYQDHNIMAVVEMDRSFNPIDTFRCGNGYQMDFHDFQLLDNGHYLVLAQDYETIRMDTVVAGGDTAAIVIGCIVQELDKNDNVVFQWRSWDHFKITDASDNIDLTAHNIDYVHANSIELDDDGNLLLSCRHMSEITKINRSTGEIIWSLGGENNQFQFLNDTRGFTYQHDVRRIDNGNITLFDNGNLSNPRYSKSLEYEVDEINKTVFLVWSYDNNEHYTGAMGNSQRLGNGNTFIGWGSSYDPAVTEVKNDGTKVLEMNFDLLYYNYRAFRFKWRTNLLTSNRYKVDFQTIHVNSNKIEKIVAKNNSANELQVTSYYSRTPEFSLIDEFPVRLEAHQSKILHILFSPTTNGYFSDNIYLRMQREKEMISQTIEVSGSTDSSATEVSDENFINEFKLKQNYPNPFNPTTKIEYQVPEMSLVTIKIYDVLGREIKTLVDEEKPAGNYEVEFDVMGLPSGIYFYQIKATPNGGQAGNFAETKKMILIK